MKNRYLLATIAFFGMLLFAGCFSQRVHNIQDTPIQGSQDKLTQLQVQHAIIKAGVHIGWKMNPIRSGFISATLKVGKKIAEVDIKYSASSYNITYKNSTNLSYKESSDKINQEYNKWVIELDKEIQQNLLTY